MSKKITKADIKKLEGELKREDKKAERERSIFYANEEKRSDKRREIKNKIQEMKDNLNGGRDKIRFPSYVKIEKSVFDTTGGCLSFKLPKDCNSIILCGNKGGGLVPYSKRPRRNF